MARHHHIPTALCLAALWLMCAPIAAAQEGQPGRIIVKGPSGTASGAAGGPITIQGAGFHAGDAIQLHWDTLSGPLLGSTTGPSFQIAATVPASAPGVHKVVAGGFDINGSAISQAVANFAVLAPASYPRPTPSTGKYDMPFPPIPAFARCSPLASNVVRGSGTITGTPLRDRIFGSAGNDVVRALEGDDCVDLAAGNDRGDGGPGADLILGRAGNDRMNGSLEDDRLLGGAGADRLTAGAGNDSVEGNAGNDKLGGGSGNDRLGGGSGRDRITGGAGRDRISAGSGRDRISARDGVRDRISCGGGRDRVTADRIDRVARSCERVRPRRR